MNMLHPLLLSLWYLIAISAAVFTNTTSISLAPHYNPNPTGWYNRTIPHPLYQNQSFIPTSSSFAFGAAYNALLGTGVISASFHPDIAVDATGRVLRVTKQDWMALSQLAERAIPPNLPFNSFNVATGFTCQTGEYFRYVTHNPDTSQIASVFARRSGLNYLTRPVGEYLSLPQSLRETLEVLEEECKWFAEDSKMVEMVFDIIMREHKEE